MSTLATAEVLHFRDHFEQYVVPVHMGESDPSTIAEHRTSITYWEEATGKAPIQEYRSAFPLFLEFLKTKVSKRGGPLAPATRRKHVQTIQFMLDLAGPETRDRGGAAVIDRPIKIPVPKGGASITKRPLTLLELSRILLACQYAAWERRKLAVSACAFWRCFLLFAYNTGLRIETLQKLRWEWLVRDDDGRHWFEIPHDAMKVDRAFRCYTSPAALAAIEPLRGLGETVFPFPYTYNHARRRFVDLMIVASIPQRGLMANKFHALRRTCSDELTKINPFAAKMQLGHSTKDVTLNHYTSPEVLVSAHTKLPQPPWTADVLTPPTAA